MTFSPIRPVTLREQIVEQVRNAIIEGRLKPGDRVTETTLAKELGVSRTPIREAFILLEREGLVVAPPNKGIFVQVFEEDDVDEIFSFRTALENFAAELNVGRLGPDQFADLDSLIAKQAALIDVGNFKQLFGADMDFHWYLVSFAHHGRLMDKWRELVAQIASLLQMWHEALNPEKQRMTNDHRRLVDAYQQEDLLLVQQVNRQLNQRIAAECKEALRILVQPSVSTFPDD